jgi:anti-sigma regulatory factor (Ser/Thr protein kinase)
MQQTFNRSLDELKRIVAFTDRVFAREDIDPSMRYVVDLCVEELFVNMIKYNIETDADILIEMRRHDHGVEVSLTDFDVDRFDPRDVEPLNVTAPVEQRTPGGLGLYLVLKMASSIHYEYRGRTSRITFVAEQG